MRQSDRQVIEIVTNLDDATPQIIGGAMRALLDEGALDVWTTPIGMKKQRPGIMLSLLCAPQDADRLALRVIELTGAMGIRRRPWDRLVLEREHVTEQTLYGPIRMKVGRLEGRVLVVSPEYDDVAQAARLHGLPERLVYDEAKAAAGRLMANWREPQA